MAKDKKPESKLDPQYGKGTDINYIVITGADVFKLAINVSQYMEKFQGFKPIGGVSFVSDDGANFYMQALYNRETQ